jgi:hypothetical protein
MRLILIKIIILCPAHVCPDDDGGEPDSLAESFNMTVIINYCSLGNWVTLNSEDRIAPISSYIDC